MVKETYKEYIPMLKELAKKLNRSVYSEVYHLGGTLEDFILDLEGLENE